MIGNEERAGSFIYFLIRHQTREWRNRKLQALTTDLVGLARQGLSKEKCPRRKMTVGASSSCSSLQGSWEAPCKDNF